MIRAEKGLFLWSTDLMMESILCFALIGLCSISFVIAGCPLPGDLPTKWHGNDVFLCARVYEHADHQAHRSCYGAQRDIPSEGDFAGARSDWWNDRISSVVVRPGCRLSVHWDTRFRGSAFHLNSGVHKHLRGWNDEISSWSCVCEYTNAPLMCTPTDSFRTLKSCQNPGSLEMKCEYWAQKGLVLGNSVTNGRSVSTTVEATVGVTIKKVFSASLGVSHTTSYDWSQTRSTDYSSVVTHKVSCSVPAGRRLDIRQVIGECGDTNVFTGHYECRDSEIPDGASQRENPENPGQSGGPSTSYTAVGCYRDQTVRAISGGFVTYHQPIASCFERSRLAGNEYFAIQAGNQCFTSSDAGQTYNQYGPSDACQDGRGGSWAMTVYRINQGNQGQNQRENPGQSTSYTAVGCYQDQAVRAISGGFVTYRHQPLARCFERSRLAGNEYFAIQAGNQCFTSSDAGQTYNQYGPSDACQDGRGGHWAMTVYRINN
ncbi:uncharacterized protein LOC121431577 isoform X2 [Lytechinus variegatus]|uniref:uncharacterized protein LOC121431577 isoform X2 n=1 Tax=Lytechinus variegatus TaxID=7654 RepID=UPI001BB23E61|nr:uncharacterized protein LOC121431577 isoform X2 [Lytechinus variegatus]